MIFVHSRPKMRYAWRMKTTPQKWPLPITSAWREALRTELASRGRGAQQALSRHLGVDPSLISRLLASERMVSSFHVAEISAWAGIDLPVITSVEAEWVAAGRALRELAPVHYAELLTVARDLAASLTKSKKKISNLDD